MRKTTIFLLSALLSVNAFASESTFVVLIPGAGSSGAKVSGGAKLFGKSYFNTFQKALGDVGIRSIVCPKTPDHDRRSLEERELECAEMIRAEEKNNFEGFRNVVIVGHSMGGLIARLLAQDPKVSKYVKSVLSISTPHQGTPLADAAVYHESRKDILGLLLNVFGPSMDRNRYIPEMQMNRANSPASVFRAQDIADNPAVDYFSISNSFDHKLSPLTITHNMIRSLLRRWNRDTTEFGTRNDGVVPEFSMIHGTYLGHLEVNHWQSACVDSVKKTKGCKQTLQLVIPAIERLVH